MAGNRGGAFGWFQNAAEHANDCGLAGAIWPEKSENGPARDGEADVINRRKMPEAPRQVRALDHGLSHVTSLAGC